ncbi:MAG: CPBP family glutamic-type intramembrane protease [Promethearchaeota archaeon]
MVISILTLLLLIPIIFGVYIENLLGREFGFLEVFSLILGFAILLLVGILINFIGFSSKNIELIKSHEVINSLIYGNKIVLWFFFPMTMIMEELIFRYYLISILISTLHVEIIISILISSVAFSLYHIHVWLRYKNPAILLSNLCFTLLLGLFNGYVFITLGIIPCIMSHYIIAFYLYYRLYQKNFKNKISSEI